MNHNILLHVHYTAMCLLCIWSYRYEMIREGSQFPVPEQCATGSGNIVTTIQIYHIALHRYVLYIILYIYM